MGNISGCFDFKKSNSDKNIKCVMDGDLENATELKNLLKKNGYDTFYENQIIPYLYELFGIDMFVKLKGSFAIAIYDCLNEKLVLCRDRLGVKPLYYKIVGNVVHFNSEIFPLVSDEKNLKLDISCLKDICTTWATVGKKTIYKNIFSVDSGECLTFEKNDIKFNKYYSLKFNVNRLKNSKQQIISELDRLINRAVESQLREDDQAAFYLSGGLDSSLICAVANRYSKEKISTFSILMDNKSTDETKYQKIMTEYLKSNHHDFKISDSMIADNFCDVILRLQTPIIKASVVPMYLLSEFVRQKGFKCIFSGQGADELFGGYDLFKEVKLRDLYEKNPDSSLDFKYNNLYHYIGDFKNKNVSALKMFFNQTKSDDLFSSHAVRFKFGGYCLQFFSEKAKQKLKNYDVIESLKSIITDDFGGFSKISRAQFLEINTFTKNYLLALEGKCATSFNRIKGEYPFLNSSIIEFASRLSDDLKINGWNEKYLLKEVSKKYLPSEIINRVKTPFRAIVDHRVLLKNPKISFIISEKQLEMRNIFNCDAVLNFINKISLKNDISEKELMLLLFILSTQTLAVHNNIIF